MIEIFLCARASLMLGFHFHFPLLLFRQMLFDLFCYLIKSAFFMFLEVFLAIFPRVHSRKEVNRY